jgi:hypothetical protein
LRHQEQRAKSRIELMQNRRLFFDDDRGVDEVLNETDKDGNGISVPARYKLVFTELKTQSITVEGYSTHY